MLNTSDLEYMLGRHENVPSPENASRWVNGRTVLVTGAGGHIGSEISRQLLTMPIARLVLIDINENGICFVMRSPEAYGKNISAEIVSICDSEELHRIFYRYKPDIVCHAAAHKHVHLMEASPRQAVKNNIFGTQNVICAALASGAEQFILISTDKALYPVGVMGQTKRICELITQAANGKMKCSAVRFGNVIGSSGSVLPLFFEQIERGGPVTITEEAATRYFMTVREASSLVLESGAKAVGGEVFSLAMGKPITIGELLNRAIKLSGKDPDDIEIIKTGLRMGEKLNEEPLVDEDMPCGVIVSTPQTNISRIACDKMLLDLHASMRMSDKALRKALLRHSLYKSESNFKTQQNAVG